MSEKTGREVLRRESLQSKVPFEEICLMLASVVRDDDEAIELTKRGRKIAAGKNQSAGIWLVAELELRISRGIIDKTEELFHEIQTRYMGEPEVEARMTRLLASLGVAENESVEAVAEGTATASGAGTGPVPAGEPSVVWTPEAEKAASVGGKLWLPGDD